MIQITHIKSKTRLIVKSIFEKKQNIFLLALSLALMVSVAMVLKEKYKVFLVYQSGSIDFWKEINPYSNWQHPLDRYLYGPVFSIFFIVFAFLPSWLGAVVWNTGNFTLFFTAVFYLPQTRYSEKERRFIFWFLFPIALTDLFYFQSNVFVTSLFLLAYSLLERNKTKAAVWVILFSGFAKIYGLIQLATLLFYRRFWQNALIAAMGAALLFFVPLIKVPFSELFTYYQSWFAAIDQRHDPLHFEVIYRLLHMLGYHSVVGHIAIIQGITLVIIGIFIIINYKKFAEFAFRTQVLAIIFSWVILFSTTAEKHTYIIAMTGLILWYLTGPKTKFDRVLIWLNFFLIIVVPIDAIFPKPVMRFLYYQLGLNLLLFTITWIRMFSYTFLRKKDYFSLLDVTIK